MPLGRFGCDHIWKVTDIGTDIGHGPEQKVSGTRAVGDGGEPEVGNARPRRPQKVDGRDKENQTLSTAED